MIDFRYHLVSLISVFLALAVGIVLGAGPLQERIGDTLTDQIDVLRADRDQIRVDLAEWTAAAQNREEWIADVGAQVTAGTLVGHDVALVVFPGASDDDLTAITDELGRAGAGLTVRLRLTDAWLEADPSYLQTFSQQLVGYLDPVPAVEATSEEVLASAVGQLLAGGAESEVLRELLAGGEDPFVELDTDAVPPAGAIVVVGPRPVHPAEPTETASPTEEARPGPDWARVVAGFATALPSVTIGAPDDLVRAVREANVLTTTIDPVGEVAATVTVPLALAAELNGVHGAYGFADSAESTAPRIVTAPPVAAPTESAEEPSAEPSGDATNGAEG